MLVLWLAGRPAPAPNHQTEERRTDRPRAPPRDGGVLLFGASMPRFTTMVEAAMRLQVTSSRLRDLICQGKLKAHQVAGRYSAWLIDQADLDRLVRARKAAS